MSTLTKLMLTGILAALLGSGCAINGIQHVEQPEAAAPNSQIDVYVLGTYYVFNQDSVFASPWVREKMLISAYLPGDWNVNSVVCHVDTGGYRTMQRYMEGDSVLTDDIDFAHVMDSLSSLSRQPSATTNYDQTLGTLYQTNGRLVKSYLLDNPVTIPAGTKADTIVQDTSGMVDSLYMKMVAYYIHFNLTTGTAEDTFPNAYITSFMPDSLEGDSYATENAISDSNMIIISRNVSVTGRSVPNRQIIQTTVMPHPLTEHGSISFNLAAADAGQTAHVTIFGADGRPYAAGTFKTTAGKNTFGIKDIADVSALEPGQYVLRIRIAENTVVRQIFIGK